MLFQRRHFRTRRSRARWRSGSSSPNGFGPISLIANDPDADRLAAAVPAPSGRFITLTGNQLGALLCAASLDRFAGPGQPLVLTSLVTSPLVEAIARSRGARFERTLTGFKWIWTAALALERRGGVRFCCGMEEALGYSVTPVVRDKDGISAAVLLAGLAARARAAGHTLLERLHATYAEHGLWVSLQRSVPLSKAMVEEVGMAVIDRLAQSPPQELAGIRVTEVVDHRTGAEARPPWLAASPLVELKLACGRLLMRPSGTEPKLKLYVDLRADGPGHGSLEEAERALGDTARAVAEALVERLASPGLQGR